MRCRERFTLQLQDRASIYGQRVDSGGEWFASKSAKKLARVFGEGKVKTILVHSQRFSRRFRHFKRKGFNKLL